jgi:gas vesicle protein
MTTGKKLMMGIAGGLAAGVLIRFLTAPEKGSDTRKKVVDQTGKIKDGLSKMLMQNRNGETKERKRKESAMVS